jgi:hypothetical protein
MDGLQSRQDEKLFSQDPILKKGVNPFGEREALYFD